MSAIRAITVFACIGLAACSTAPISYEEAKSPSSNRFYFKSGSSESIEETSRIIVTRDKGLFGSGCSYKLSINGNPVASLRRQEAVSISVKPGEHFIKAESSGGICGNSAASETINAIDGGIQYFRLAVSTTGAPSLTREK